MVAVAASAALASASTDAAAQLARGSGDALSFLGLGDWGMANAQQAAVAKGMASSASKLGSQFVLNVGDNSAMLHAAKLLNLHEVTVS